MRICRFVSDGVDSGNAKLGNPLFKTTPRPLYWVNLDTETPTICFICASIRYLHAF